MSEIDMTEDRVREEHLAAVDQRKQWGYLLTVLLLSPLLMVGLIALLDALTA
jgi:hypothetical protein